MFLFKKHPFLLGEFSKKYGKELLDLYLNGPLFPGRIEDEEEEPVIILLSIGLLKVKKKLTRIKF